MLQSTHYELKLVEGSDIVNPLVIDRPNYEEIDGVMYENESKSIGSATELKSGTIHALTRSKGNQRFFCFTATSNYEAGDTFTVDSVPVTALLPNGTSLPNMAYVINGTVLCSLIGTLLTVYTVGAGLADDSLRLGGELPEYYATASALTSVSNTASSAQTMAVNNSNAISEINSNLSHKIGQVSTDGVKTNATLLNELYASISPYISDNYDVYIVFNSSIYRKDINNSYTRVSFDINNQLTRIDSLYVASSNSKMVRMEIKQTGNTYSDSSNSITSSGYTFTAYATRLLN